MIMKKHTKVISWIMTVIMLFSAIAVTAFASDYTFAYYFADEEKTEIWVTGFKGNVPANGEVEIPDEIDGYTVVGIAEHTFDSLEALKSVIIPATVIAIDEDAFYECPNIINIEVKNKNEIDVGEEVFDSTEWFEAHKKDFVISGTTLVEYKGSDDIIAVPENCTMIADGAFKGNKAIKAVYIDANVKTIGTNAFAGCTNLAEVHIGDKNACLTLGDNAFEGTAWVNEYPGSFVVLGSTLVKYKGTASYVAIPNVITSIGDGAFRVDDESKHVAFRVKVPTSIKKFNGDCFFLYKSASDVYPDMLVYKNSTAEAYCKDIDINYGYAVLPGDANNDGKVTPGDARFTLRYAAHLEGPYLSDELSDALDITADKKVGVDDARLILRIAANINEFTVEDLLTMPRTAYETLFTAAMAVDYAKAYGCAYSKTAYQKIDSYKMNTNTQTYLDMFKSELTPEKSAVTVTYGQDTAEAKANLFDITLVDSEMIKDYSCIIKDGKYRIKIVLKDEVVTGDDTKTGTMFPVEKYSHFANKMAGKYWYKWSSTNVDYTMTYTGCTLELVADIDTLVLSSMTVTMGYDFDITGKIGGIAIKDGSKHATAKRTDTIKYTSFVYFDK